jgi:hypothetical protein
MIQLQLCFAPSIRELALMHVSALLARGYDERRAREEFVMGASWPNGGYEIRQGLIRVPAHGPGYKFKFAKLAAMIRRHHE